MNDITKMQMLKFNSDENISTCLDEVITNLKSIFTNCSDFVLSEMEIENSKRFIVVYLEGLVNTDQMQQSLLRPLLNASIKQINSKIDLMNYLAQSAIPISSITELTLLNEIIDHITTANIVLILDDSNHALSVSLQKWEQRSIDEPNTEVVVRGPREGFNENINFATALIRRRIRTPNLKMEKINVGQLTKTDVIVTYIQSIANDTLVETVKRRIRNIELSAVLESGYIEEMIRDSKYSPFPVLQVTERPDVIVAGLLEGRVGILVDGTPFALLAPMTFWSSLQSNEDYYNDFYVASLLRLLRLIFTAISLLLPSIYIALTTFHQEMIPPSLLISIASAREKTPFPSLVEALLMEVTFEALREAGVRLPKSVGQAVSIVGALVIGQAAVQAGIVSAPMVIIVSITGIANFLIPRFNMAISIRILRFPIMGLAASFGLYGIGIALIVILIHVVNLESFGTPYFSPVSPFNFRGIKDVFIRSPWWTKSKNKQPN
jgi:hypothetical protein